MLFISLCFLKEYLQNIHVYMRINSASFKMNLAWLATNQKKFQKFVDSFSPHMFWYDNTKESHI